MAEETRYDAMIEPRRANCSDPSFVRSLLVVIAVGVLATAALVTILVISIISSQATWKDAIMTQATALHADTIEPMIYLQSTVACNAQYSAAISCLLQQRFYADTYGEFYDCNTTTLVSPPHPSEFPACAKSQRIENFVLQQTVEDINEYFEDSSFMNTEMSLNAIRRSIISDDDCSSSSSS